MYKNKTVIISGGCGGIGFSTAKKFALLGANISIGDILPIEEASKKIALIENIGVKCLYTKVDISNPQAVKKWVDETENQLGTATIIIVNAAVARLSDFDNVTPDEWVKDLNINVNGAFFLSKFTTDKLKKDNKEGSVVFVGSWAAVHVHKHMPAYSVSKAALSMLSKCLALELAPHNILVNEIAPGYVDAGLSGRIWNENPGRKEIAAQKVPTKKVISAEEVADNIIFLCHPNNKHMIGSTLLMDGGLSLL